MYHKQIKIGNIATSEREIKDLLKAWVAISIAFAIVIIGGLRFSLDFFAIFIISGLTVGVGFLVHELAHKVTAQKYGCFAEFRSFDQMLFLAVLMSFFGFVFAAPGAVMISGPVGVRRNGKISAAGPLANLVLAFIFLSIMINFGVNTLSKYGFLINTWLALFNMIPLGNFDGKKILVWNKKVYGIMIAIAVVFMFMQGIVF